MKCSNTWRCAGMCHVAPLAGAWIEIILPSVLLLAAAVAPLAGAWIEMETPAQFRASARVAPLAGAWIEMPPALMPTLFLPKSPPSRGRGLK